MRTILVLCDLCHPGETDLRKDAETVTISVGRLTDRSLDLCAAHRYELIAPLEEALRTHGAPSGPKAAAGREQQTGSQKSKALRPRIPCPIDGTTFSGMQAVVGHIRSAHRFDFGEAYTEKYLGSTCLLCGKENAGRAHSHSAHHLGGGALALFAEAQHRGDPLGLIEKRLAWLRELILKGGSYDAAA